MIKTGDTIRINQERLTKFCEEVRLEFISSEPFNPDEKQALWNKYNVEDYVLNAPITLASLNEKGRIRKIKSYISHRVK